MPILIESLYEIAKEKNRDVLYIGFFDKNSTDPRQHYKFEFAMNFDWKNSEARKDVIKWLDNQNIKYQMAGYPVRPYAGELYIDIPFNEDNPKYKLCYSHFETEEGKYKIPGVFWYYIPLKTALEELKSDGFYPVFTG